MRTLLYNVQSSPGAQPASYLILAIALSLGLPQRKEETGCQADHLSALRVEVKNGGASPQFSHGKFHVEKLEYRDHYWQIQWKSYCLQPESVALYWRTVLS